ncbi:uncharacterized protein LOC141703026 [Apium graveolens]|uniref:uncharacterized protein LOC141703026 n=1 Tax=Apium graveolens TaxID=4045 RepID=UPI003D7AD749
MEGLKDKDGTVALSYPMLSKSNYTAWAMKMRAVMKAHGIWEAIEPTYPKATVDVKADRFKVDVIYQAILEDILLAVAEQTSAKGVWDDVKTMCQGVEKVKEAIVQTLKMELETLSMKGTELMDEFSMTLSGLVTNIRELGETMKEHYVVKNLLRVVPSKYLQITSAMEQFGKIDEMTFE